MSRGYKRTVPAPPRRTARVGEASQDPSGRAFNAMIARGTKRLLDAVLKARKGGHAG